MAVEEHRLALVLNGGVSLAIWMGGVTHEIDLVRRRADPVAARSAGKDAPVLKAWQEALRGKPRLRVDVIGGTSAGGLNGVFLAAAIARGGDLGPLKDLWMQRAQLGPRALLKADRPTVNSLLNGDFFLGEVADALGRIRGRGAGEEVSLITTASAVGGRPRRFVDSAGAPFGLDDHRRRYRFRRGGGGFRYAPDDASTPFPPIHEVDDFTDDPLLAEALALAGRATAAIPGVFDPVLETPTLRRHRRLPATTDDSPPDRLLDGGLLDNAPFDAVLDSIAKQSVSTTWTRTLGYIVPSEGDGHPDPSPAAQAGLPPWTALVPKLLTYPGESNLREGIERLGTMLRTASPDVDADRFRRLVSGDGLDRVATAAAGLLDLYRAARAGAGVAEAVEAASQGAVRALRPPREDDVTTVLAEPQSWLPADLGFAPGEPWRWGLAAADRVVRLLLRSIRDLPGAQHDGQRRDLHVRTEWIHAVRERVQAALAAQPIGTASPGPTIEGRRAYAAAIAAAITTTYDDLGVPAALGRIVGEAAGLAATALGSTAEAVLRAALALEVVDGASGLPITSDPTPIFDFRRFDVRVPEGVFDFALDDRPPADLLYGMRLAHFAAFADPVWRGWDWMWGRISATVHLCELYGVPEAAPRVVRAVVQAEGYTIAAVEKQARALLTGDTETSRALFDRMRKGRIIGLTADALLRMGSAPSPTSPPVPAAVAVAGAGVAAAVSRATRRDGEPPRRPLLQRPVIHLARMLAKRLLPPPDPAKPAVRPDLSPRLRVWVRRLAGGARFLLWGWLDP